MSEFFDRGARVLLDRAYRAGRGVYVGTRIADPGPNTRAWMATQGIDWRARDDPGTPNPRGGLDCKDRWTRAFVRALYYNHRRYEGATGTPDALKVEIGRRVPARGIIPPGRAIRVRLLAGGRAARRAARQLPDDDRIFDHQGDATGGRASDVALRDW